MKRYLPGFTVLELLIATTVFSVILLLSLVGVTRMGRLYYKGLSQSQAQELSRQITDEVVGQIQFGKASITPQSITSNGVTGGDTIAFCIGDYRYRLTLNRALSNSGDPRTSPTVMLRGSNSGGCSTDATVASLNETEMMSRGMRVTKLRVVPATGDDLWDVEIGITYGADDLLLYAGAAGTEDTSASYENVLCNGGVAGSELCASSSYRTTVLRRLQ